MLQTLTLKNFAIVKALELDFNQGFSVITGETGAGKSILLDALNLLLGEKADYSKIRTGCDEAILSALFDISDVMNCQAYLRLHDLLDSDEICIIKRVITSTGKSRNYINGQPVSLSQLKELGLYLVDIHGQNTHHSLMSEASQRVLLDKYAEHDSLLSSVAKSYHAWHQAEKRFAMVQQKAEKWQTELEIFQWKNKELSELNPQPDEWTILSKGYDELSHRNEIMQVAQQIDDLINQDQGLQDKLAKAQIALEDFCQLESRFQESSHILQSIEAELGEVSANMRAVYSQSEVDYEQLHQMESRIAALNSMAKKYGIHVEQLPAEWRNVKGKLQQLEDNQNIAALTSEMEQLKQQYSNEAQILSQSRQKMAIQLSKEVTEVMRTLSMGNAQFEVTFKDASPSAYGNEQVVFKVAMNLGSDLKPLQKIASGGELSRISLALQVVISKYNQTPTLIFDEVDVGIGGKVGDMVGRYLQQLSTVHQILSVTHLPQVAVYGHQHYVVNKREEEGSTVSEVKYLNQEDRVQEIARMLGGEQITEITLKHAAESLQLAQGHSS